MLIKPMQEQDLEAVFSIEEVAHKMPWSKGILFNSQGDNYLNLTLWDKEKVQGFAICQKVLDEATLFNIAIAPQSQGQGYGTKLLQALCQQLQAEGMKTLWLEVRESNHCAKQLYLKQGFTQEGLRKKYYPNPDGTREDALVMRYDLTQFSVE